MGDFGIAKVLECTMGMARTQIGTPYYLSPELCQERPYTTPSDIWAMGCILYEMCALKVPFDGQSIPKLVNAIVRGTVPSVPDKYSSFTRQLVAEMLNRDPNKRPGCDEILQKPEIQAVVRSMVEEAQEKEAKVEDSKPAAKAAPKAFEGLYKESAGTYKKDDLVEYLSSAHQTWLPAVVINVDGEGRVLLDLKPNTWMTKELQATSVRPRPAGVVGSIPPRVAGSSPRRQFSPSSGTPRASSRDGRPGSRAGSPMNRSPSANLGQPLSARGAAGSYRVGDLCEFWSNSHGDWLPAQVVNTDASGRICIDLKPNTWLSKEDQTSKLRPRRFAAAERPSSANRRLPQMGGSPQLPRPPIHRSPSWGNGPDRRAASPAGRALTPLGAMNPRAASPSNRAMTPLRAPSPSGRPMTPGRRASSRDPPGRAASPQAGYGARPPRVAGSPLRMGGANIAGLH